ncbi:MAG: M48 family metalloprotease [Magnetococcus sp. MYC-9]
MSLSVPWAALLACVGFLLVAAAPARAEFVKLNDVLSLLTNKYGLVDPSADPQVARVQQIFERVQDAADKRGNRMPQLSIVNRPEQPWAISLPDGHILLSSGAVSLCYQDVSTVEGDTRIAFVLGHELAHLAKNDFWDMDLYLAIAGEVQKEGVKKLPSLDKKRPEEELRQRRETARRKETEADDLGFLYAGIAGYPVQTLLEHGEGSHDNFFSLWNAGNSGDALLHDLHPPAGERQAFLRARLERLAEGIPFFHYGVRFAHFGHCEQALVLLRNFLQIFPSREVYNNLGACHLQQAQRELRALGTAPPYWLPVWLDPTSRADPLLVGLRGTSSAGESPPAAALPDRAGHELEQAVEYLEQAVAADARYLPARLNLATAHHHRGETLKARASLEDALRIAPDNRQVAGWHALLLYLDSQENSLGEAALPRWSRLAQPVDAPSSLVFNHALLMKKMGRPAQSWWKRLAARVHTLPAHYAQVVCREVKGGCPAARGTPRGPLPWPLPVQPGTDLDTVDRGKLFAGWQMSSLTWPARQPGRLYRRGTEVEVLDLDGYAAMVVLRNQGLGTAKAFKKKWGHPLSIRPMAEAEAWIYAPQQAVMVRDGQVRELWAIRSEP